MPNKLSFLKSYESKSKRLFYKKEIMQNYFLVVSKNRIFGRSFTPKKQFRHN